jgi:4-amino-4-deoxy-L-arabinose transferase-like glycosyltransferase
VDKGDVRRSYGPSLATLFLLALILWGGQYLRRGLWEPDEARYAYVAREMRAGGHWFAPQIHGEYYPDKPPLMFWLTNAASILTGGRINGVSARLPSLLGAIASLWVCARLLGRWQNDRAARRAAFVLMSAFLFWWEASWGRIDSLLCGLEMGSVYCFFRWNDTRRAWRLALGYGLAGLAVFAKGPVGLAVPLGIYAVGTWAGGDGRALRAWHWAWGPVLALSLPAAWLLGAWLQGAPPEYFAAMFTEKSFSRVVQSVGHARPIYYFLWHFPVDFLPWTLLLPAAIKSMPDRLLRRRLLAWGLFVIALFSLFVCKRNLYILAAYPAAAMLVGAGWEHVQSLPRRWALATGYSGAGLLGLLGAGLTVACAVPAVPVPWWTLLPGGLCLLAGAVALVRVFRLEGLSDRWLYVFAGTMLAFQFIAGVLILPAANPLKTPPPELRQAAQARLRPDQPLYLYGQQLAILPLYAGRSGQVLESAEELQRTMAAGTNGIVVFSQNQWKEIAPLVKVPVTAHPFDMGSKHLVWVEFPASVQ